MADVPANGMLTIWWNAQAGGSELRPGFVVFGFGKGKITAEPAFPVDAWPPTTERELWEPILGDGWTIIRWNVFALDSPSARSPALPYELILDAMIETGCQVAWLSSEPVEIAYPPHLFDPQRMSGGVFLAKARGHRLVGTVPPDGAMRPISDADMVVLRRSAGW